MRENSGGKAKAGWKGPHRNREISVDEAPATSAAPDEGLSQAVHRVQRHELERRVERLSAELAKLKRTLASLARFRTIIDQAGEAIFLIEPETGKFVDVNETGLRWLGLPRSRLLSLTVTDLDVAFPLEYAEAKAEHVTDTRNVDRPWMFGGGMHRRRDGSSFPVEVAISQRRFVNRTYTLVVARESRPRRDAEQALRESQERYQTLFDLTQDAIYLTTRDGRIADVNQVAIDLFGYPREEFVGLRARNLYIDATDISRFQQLVEEQGFVRELLVQFQASDGTAISGSLTATLRHTGDGVIGGYQCLIRMPTTEPNAADRIKQQEVAAKTPAQADKSEAEIPDTGHQQVPAAHEDFWSQSAAPEGDADATSGGASSEDGEQIGDAEVVGEPDLDLVVNRLVGSTRGYELRDTGGTVSQPGLSGDAHSYERTRVEVGRRAPWQHKPKPPEPVVEARPARQWPLLLLGVLLSLYGWSSLAGLTYPYGSGLLEWQLSVRVLALALLGITVAGSGRARWARLVSVAIVLVLAVLVTTYANYLMDFPFGLKDVVPDTRTALFGAVRRATEFTAVAVLFLGIVSRYLWRLGSEPGTQRLTGVGPKL